MLNAVANAPILQDGYYISPGDLGKFAEVIIEGVGIIGVGIILFALVLKAITLPFDIYQRIKMRKQTLIMRKMKPELEKLQKQYADDKQMYNQKMMELYKKNGYSMLGACLPMIISMVILIIAFAGFRGYSTSANLAMYEGMSHAYNSAIAEYRIDGDKEHLPLNYHLPVEGKDADGLTIYLENWTDDNKITLENWTNLASHEEDGFYYTVGTFATTSEDSAESENSQLKYLVVQSAKADDNVCMFYWYPLFEDGTIGGKEYKIDIDKLSTIAAEDIEKIQKDENVSKEEACQLYYAKKGAAAARDWYKGEGEYEGQHNNSGFLWIKNVWRPDVSYNSPIIKKHSDFIKDFNNATVKFEDKSKAKLKDVLDETSYGYLTMELSGETKTANGYYILIILSIGLMVLSQFISMRSQKETNKYQTVDGSGVRTQKIMLIVMPIIYAIFAFMYSAAFSVYMVMSSFITICTTLITNLIIDRVYHKKEVAEIKEQNSRIPAWMKARDAAGKKNKNQKNGK